MCQLSEVGKISSSFGLKGAFKVDYYTNDYQDFYYFDHLIIFGDKEEKKIEKVWNKKNSLYIKLEGIDSISTVERLIGYSLYVKGDYIEKLSSDTYYNKDLIGIEAFSGDLRVGFVKEVINGPSQDILVITNGTEEAMVPFVKEFVNKVDINKKRLDINLIEGLISWI